MTSETCLISRRQLLQLTALALPGVAGSWIQADEHGAAWTMDQRYRFYRAPGGVFWSDLENLAGDQFLALGLSHALLPGSVSPEGRHLAYTALDRRSGSTIRIAPIDWRDGRPSAGPSYALTHGQTFDTAPRFSSDGRLVTWASLEAGRWSLQRRRFSG